MTTADTLQAWKRGHLPDIQGDRIRLTCRSHVIQVMLNACKHMASQLRGTIFQQGVAIFLCSKACNALVENYLFQTGVSNLYFHYQSSQVVMAKYHALIARCITTRHIACMYDLVVCVRKCYPNQALNQDIGSVILWYNILIPYRHWSRMYTCDILGLRV